MQLTTVQQATLKAAILADPAYNTLPVNNNSALTIATSMNIAVTPAFVVWKNSESIGNIGKAFNATELAGLSTLNNTRLQTLAQYLANGVTPSLASIRQFFDDIFSGAGGVLTRAALLALWKRTPTANKIEKLFSAGTGTDVSPATMGPEGNLDYIDIVRAMGWPE